MKFIKRTVPFVLGIVLMAGTVMAQGQMQQMQNNQADSVSDEELQQFVKTTQELQGIQEDIQSKVQDMVGEEDMEFQRFQQIMMSKQNPQMADQVEVTQKEEETIQKIQPELQKISQEAQQKQISVIEEQGLSPERFQQIAQAVQSDQQMMQRFQQMSQEMSGDEEDGS